jgi:hypothetical protein
VVIASDSERALTAMDGRAPQIGDRGGSETYLGPQGGVNSVLFTARRSGDWGTSLSAAVETRVTWSLSAGLPGRGNPQQGQGGAAPGRTRVQL